jgi:Zn finger protein HypA/HybF involved in hydrogenase expression
MARMCAPTDAEISAAVSLATSVSKTAKLLGLSHVGSSYDLVRKAVVRLQLDTSHWGKLAPTRVNLNSAFVVNGPHTRSVLKRVIIREKLLPYLCAECGLGEMWNGKPLTLRLDHINGESHDDRLHNLRFVCPNCDSQSPTFCGRNKRAPAKLSTCLDCPAQTSGLRCKPCSLHITNANLKRATKIQWPPHDELQAEVDSSSYVAVAKRLGVSDTAVKKHLVRCT